MSAVVILPLTMLSVFTVMSVGNAPLPNLSIVTLSFSILTVVTAFGPIAVASTEFAA